MKIWIVTYGDGCEFGGQFLEAYDDEETANNRAVDLEAAYRSKGYTRYGFDVQEYELNTPAKHAI